MSLLRFACQDGHLWEIWNGRQGVEWRLIERNAEIHRTDEEVQAGGLDEWDEQRAEIALCLEEMDQPRESA